MDRANDLVPNAGFPIAYSLVWYILLNDCWKAYYAKNEFTPGEALLLERQAGANVHKVASVVFGHPQLTWSDRFIVMKKRLLSEREVAFRLEPGRSVGWLSEIRDNVYDGSQVLTIKADMLGSSVAYRADGSVRLRWGAEPDFSFTGEDTLRLKLMRGYQTKRGVDLYSLEQPIKGTLRELSVFFQPGPDTAAWVLEGEPLGRLEKEGSTRYYYPPVGPGSGVVLDVNNKTGRPAAVISSVPKWFTADTVKATQNGESAYSTFATYHAPQTHYLKASLENGKFKLELWYYDVGAGKDLPVPEDDTEWGVVSGNGTLSPSGVFNPAASNPSSFSVVWARDTSDPRLLLWAFTIIPMPLYSPEEAVALYNG